MPLVSVIVPIYKVEKYLNKCIESIINQTYKNLEIILVDDGSPDNCPAMCDEYAKKDDRIIVIHKENGGLSSARNSGIDVASGEYLLFVDSDDYISEYLIEKLIEIASKENADIVTSEMIPVYENDKPVVFRKDGNYRVYDNVKTVKLLLNKKIESFAWGKLIKRSLFYNIEFPKGKKYEDIGTTYKILLQSKTICISDFILYAYLQRNDSIIGNPSIQSFLDYYEMVKSRRNDLKKYGEFDSEIVLNDIFCFLDWEKMYIKHFKKYEEVKQIINKEYNICKKYLKNNSYSINEKISELNLKDKVLIKMMRFSKSLLETAITTYYKFVKKI